MPCARAPQHGQYFEGWSRTSCDVLSGQGRHTRSARVAHLVRLLPPPPLLVTLLLLPLLSRLSRALLLLLLVLLLLVLLGALKSGSEGSAQYPRCPASFHFAPQLMPVAEPPVEMQQLRPNCPQSRALARHTPRTAERNTLERAAVSLLL
jgi:hypothetical protein